MSKKGQSNYEQILLLIIGLMLLAVIGLFIHNKRRQSEHSQKLLQTAKKMSSTIAAENNKKSSVSSSLPIKSSLQNENSSATKAPQPESFETQLQKKSLANFKRFTDIAHLNFDLPRQMQLEFLDLDENILAIYGHDHVTKSNVTALAYGKDASPDQAINFLRSETAMLPNLAGTEITHLNPAQQLPTPNPETGLKAGTMWTGQLKNGNEVNIVFLRRQDSQGTYMFVYTAPPSFFRDNDGAFDKLYENVRARPR